MSRAVTAAPTLRVIRLDAGGNLLWQRCLGGSGDDHAADVLPTADGGFLVAATVHSKDGDVTGFHDAPGFVCDAWLAKLNATGGLVWQRAYGGTGSDYAAALAPAADGGYIMAGYTYSADGDIALNRGWSDVWVMKVSATGAPAWGRTSADCSTDYAGGVRQTADGGYVVAGYANSADGNVTGTHGGYDAWVLRLDAGGNLLWQKALGGLGLDSAMDVLLPADGGYLVAGGTYSTSPFVTGQHGGKDAWLVRLGADPSAVVAVPSGSGAPQTATPTGDMRTSTATAGPTSRTWCCTSTRCHGSPATNRSSRSTATETAGSTSPTSSGSSTTFSSLFPGRSVRGGGSARGDPEPEPCAGAAGRGAPEENEGVRSRSPKR